ncbi:uncharacterized protein KY384_001158 [Bacidia gigantensis]|uniref:uncharacterized protein n=1 Tax=Bacidia gigantensis TaxID=2732470 RepID=UPI001D038C2D|nr:uncharacterized protein KY384_001158 [Bacidia gigantensis]KAG8534314.1 hypothetical protein KY384_001158 [Bacidia gigantensis]
MAETPPQPPIIQALDDNPNVGVARHQDVVCALDHVPEPWTPSQNSAVVGESQLSAVDVAREYLLEVAEAYEIPKSFLRKDSAQLAAGDGLRDSPPALEAREERFRFNSTAISYQQTLLGLPVWGAEISVTLNEDQKVINSVSSVQPHATQPRMPGDNAKYLKSIEVESLREVLALRPGEGQITINQQSLLVYQYRKDNRQILARDQGPSDEAHHQVPTLILNQVPDSIQDERYYVVREVLFSYPPPGFGTLHWRTFVEVETGVVLYLRALTTGISNPVNGSLFTVDPITRTGSSAPLPTGQIDKLNLLRQKILLSRIKVTSPQALRGDYAEIKHSNPPDILVPTSSNNEFDGDVESDTFAAVNGYYHITRLFELVDELGIGVSTLFQNTTLPVPVDHRGLNDDVNAQAPGNTLGNGSGGFLFGRAAQNSKIGIAADFRVTAHEFGHALLWNAVRSPNFGFAHSPGDSIAVISCDPGSQAPDRFDTFPWSPIRRSHGRKIADGWAWGGAKFIQDTFFGYEREQILSTSLFRLYQAIGGDALGNITKQTWASKYTLYLILGGIAQLTQKSPVPDTYVSFMINADKGKILGYPAGAVRKIIRWAFEKQGLFQPVSAPSPVQKEGAPPQVDVYIDDGRKGEYNYVADFNNAPGIWNRQKGDGVQVHQTPVISTTNFVYVTIQNRGAQAAQGIQVKAYVSTVEKAQKWDAQHTDFAELTLTTPDNIPALAAGGSLNVGPFKWTPDQKFAKHTLLVSVSAQSDLSNVDPNSNLECAKGPIDLDKLVPFDNNLAMRTV